MSNTVATRSFRHRPSGPAGPSVHAPGGRVLDQASAYDHLIIAPHRIPALVGDLFHANCDDPRRDEIDPQDDAFGLQEAVAVAIKVTEPIARAIKTLSQEPQD